MNDLSLIRHFNQVYEARGILYYELAPENVTIVSLLYFLHAHPLPTIVAI